MSLSNFRQDRSIAYLDGVRGVAAFAVFGGSFLQAFYPSFFTLRDDTTHLDGFEMQFAQGSFAFLYNSNFLVSLFFVLSGYVLGHKYFVSGNEELLVSGLHRRFLRLFIPVAVTIILSYLLFMSHLYFNDDASQIARSAFLYKQWMALTDPTTQLLQSLAYGTMFLGGNLYNPVLWTMTYEFYGSLFVFAFLLFTHFTRRFRGVMICLVIYYFYMLEFPIYLSFVLGIALFYVEQWAKVRGGKLLNVWGAALLAGGLLVASVCSRGPQPDTWLASLKDTWDYTRWGHGIAAFGVIAAFLVSPLLRRVAGFRPLVFLGYISFSFYLLHTLVISSFGAWLFLRVYNGDNYNTSALIAFAGTTAVLVPASWLMAKYIDAFAIRFARRVYDFVSRPGRQASPPEQPPSPAD